MSADTKRRRGEAGRSKAESSPFRLNGLPSDWQARRMGAHRVPAAPSGGSTLMRGIVGGIWAEFAFGVPMPNLNDNRVAHAADRCTHSMLT